MVNGLVAPSCWDLRGLGERGFDSASGSCGFRETEYKMLSNC
jgi:hypothetical protein